MQMLRDLCPPILFNFAKKVARRHSRVPVDRQSLQKLDLSDRQLLVSDPDILGVYRSYFVQEKYRFTTETESPLIIDCGAYVGVSVHFWKRLYPKARVIAFEPDPVNFAALASNCLGLDDVFLHNAALWSSDGTVPFSASASVGGHVASLTNTILGEKIEVRALRLCDFLRERVDMLKLDIEGSELEVLLDCRDHLKNVRNIFIEYHSFEDMPQRLGTFFTLLEEAGFRIHAHSELPAERPFMDRPVINRKDFRLNIFGIKSDVPPNGCSPVHG